jgi:hypothetical protein
MHGGAAPQVRAAARVRLDMAADRMAQALLGIATADDAPFAVKLAAIRDALDRAGMSPKTAVQIEVGPSKPWEQLLEGIAKGGLVGGSRSESRAQRGVPTEQPALAQGVSAHGEIVDAEVVEEPPACGGCGLSFPAELPEWLDTYPEFCAECRAERGLPDPPRRTASAAFEPGEHPCDPNDTGLSGADGGTGNLQGSQRLTGEARYPQTSSGTLVTWSEAVSQGAEANRDANRRRSYRV